MPSNFSALTKTFHNPAAADNHPHALTELLVLLPFRTYFSIFVFIIL